VLESHQKALMMMMVYYCLSKRTPLLNTLTFAPVESELNTLSAALAGGLWATQKALKREFDESFTQAPAQLEPSQDAAVTRLG
jgi:hypothetical protein